MPLEYPTLLNMHSPVWSTAKPEVRHYKTMTIGTCVREGIVAPIKSENENATKKWYPITNVLCRSVT